ncbi:unnamed protein product [Bemisia tabaci]|uniref:Aminopeptidase N n=1 Tax=Bemisia tabaci TaxID=7038 RepID=A0A9P0CBZ2_BEMTA|nr:unnamed protein product [Bemisia tabaci]
MDAGAGGGAAGGVAGGGVGGGKMTRGGVHLSATLAFLLTTAFVAMLIVSSLLAARLLSRLPGPEPPGAGRDPDETALLRQLDALAAPHKPRLDVRLPASVRPSAYDIRLLPFIHRRDFTFHGDVVITLDVKLATRNFTLHAVNLSVERYRVTQLPPPHAADQAEEELDVESMSLDPERQFLVFRFAHLLLSGTRYRLFISYVGHINDELVGFYRSSYTVDEQVRWLAATQFQATEARRAFPCFDEPAMKARFTIHIGRHRNMTSISNMPRISTTPDVEGLPDYVWDHYQESVPMSTYLVAFVVSDFASMSTNEEQQGNGTRFKVWARKAALAQAHYSLEIGPRILEYFEEYFGIKYPLPKIDMIALPDFQAGAMENWGLITYRETAMLYQQETSSMSQKERVVTVVAHELAHQWFGNLVTLEWWSDLWLNEGFASYVEYIGMDSVEPKWHVMEQLVTNELHLVLTLDSLQSSHPVYTPVSHPDEISEIFDRISYGKGACLIRMMDHFLTTPVFKKGLNHYLLEKSYQNANQNDLWHSLTLFAHQDGILEKSETVKQIMDTWTLQTGYPLVTVIRNYEDGSATVTQKRFYLYPENIQRGDRIGGWWIPITYTTAGLLDFESTRPDLWLKAEHGKVLASVNATAQEWVLFNVQQTGIYRVNYDPENWRLLIDYLQNPKTYTLIAPINRAQLVNDAMNLARSGLLDYSIALNVTTYLEHELDYSPWKAAFSSFDFLDIMLAKSGHYYEYKEYLWHLMSGLYDSVGFTDPHGDELLTVYKRNEVLHHACNIGHKDCIDNAITLFQSWKRLGSQQMNPISANLRGVVYCNAIKVGGESDWQFLWEKYLKSNVGSEKDLILAALGCSREPWILSRYLEWSMNETSGVRKQDASRVFGAVASTPIGQPLAFNFVRNQWSRIVEYLGSQSSMLSGIIKSSVTGMNTEYEARDLQNFVAKHHKEMGAAYRAAFQALEKTRANMKWMKQNYKQIVQWLKSALVQIRSRKKAPTSLALHAGLQL